ncbi:MAG: ABC transporter ATP-binding protein [Firmicutes bacterium]|nr:ABC transporter ATP-binding protein [Bacillota bacterium]HXL04440.1 ABC transporter ATP-binding protein [Bacillota bacterium]
MAIYHEDEALGKAYDQKLMRRLLKYARPYRSLLAVCIVLLLVITGLDLLQPYLIKVAIDNHMNALTEPMLAFVPGNEPRPGISFDEYVFVREKEIKRDPAPDSGWAGRPIPARIEQNEDAYYLLMQFPGGDITRRELTPTELCIFKEYDTHAVIRLSLILLGALSLAFLLNYIEVYILQYTGLKIVSSMRLDVFQHLQRLSLSFFDKNPTGRLVTRVTNDMDALNEMYTAVLVNLFKDVFLLVGIIIVMLKMNVELALVSFAVLPVIVCVAAVFRKKARDAYRAVRVRLARINAAMAENISGMRIIQIFGREAKKFREFDEINRDYFHAGMQELKVHAIFRPAMDLISSLALALLLWFGGRRVMWGTLEFGMLFAFTNYLQQFFRPINDLTEKYNIMQSAMASAERIFLLLDADEVEPDPVEPVIIPRLKGEIEFQNVWFTYNGEDWVLKDVSFRIEPGETCAFVGATGAGKTSIISLIGRMYEISHGKILIDGVDIRNIPRHELRRHIGVVHQDVFLFTGDIKSNIRLGDLGITDEQVREAACFVNADKFIRELPGEYDAKVKERGATLSSGERQLLAFARALARDPAILVLDEATAHIDTETEALIQDGLAKLVRGRTTLVVAHRLSTIQNADKIIVIHKGRVREIGTHQELLARRGIYYQLYLLQYKEQMGVS